MRQDARLDGLHELHVAVAEVVLHARDHQLQRPKQLGQYAVAGREHVDELTSVRVQAVHDVANSFCVRGERTCEAHRIDDQWQAVASLVCSHLGQLLERAMTAPPSEWPKSEILRPRNSTGRSHSHLLRFTLRTVPRVACKVRNHGRHRRAADVVVHVCAELVPGGSIAGLPLHGEDGGVLLLRPYAPVARGVVALRHEAVDAEHHVTAGGHVSAQPLEAKMLHVALALGYVECGHGAVVRTGPERRGLGRGRRGRSRSQPGVQRAQDAAHSHGRQLRVTERSLLLVIALQSHALHDVVRFLHEEGGHTLAESSATRVSTISSLARSVHIY
ncbi:LOW QUALITY PROTEIN: hypothetical protein PHMEG_00020513 [Phytophthora megakarya]|uniref:Uncharacterized protein n=1 Tax=Phytophthora megakarya TaxID=4795 RepID=A0A225VQR3_9STRA|nr:LOW QUALITY PROTEIN: hypothetical protein PHMEG_00020513 [Phytophthora megakarya]